MANICWCETALKGVACRRCHTTLEGAGCWCHTTLVSHHRVLQIFDSAFYKFLTPRFTNFDSAFYKFWLRVLQILTRRFTNFWLRVLQILTPRFTNFWLRVLQIHSTPRFTTCRPTNASRLFHVASNMEHLHDYHGGWDNREVMQLGNKWANDILSATWKDVRGNYI